MWLDNLSFMWLGDGGLLVLMVMHVIEDTTAGERLLCCSSFSICIHHGACVEEF